MPSTPTPAPGDSRRGVVIFAHGARQSEWARPFAEIARGLRAARPGVEVKLAFLEVMAPPLDDAVRALAASGCVEIVVIPAFLGMGGHVTRDLPAIVKRLRAELPAVEIKAVAPVGEDADVLRAMVEYCGRQIDG